VKILFFFLIIIFTNSATASVSLEFTMQSSEVKQGSIEKSIVVLDQVAVQKIGLQKLKGQTLGEVIYIHSVGPLLKKDGSNLYESEIQLVFIKNPSNNVLLHKFENQELKIKLNDINFISTEGAEKLIYQDFFIPDRKSIIKWALSFISAIVVIGIAFFVYRKQKTKKLIRQEKMQVKNKLFQAMNYDEIIAIWISRTEILNTFPHIVRPFKKFESVLYQYQFKPIQTDEEKEIVESNYREFLKEISGGFDGV